MAFETVSGNKAKGPNVLGGGNKQRAKKPTGAPLKPKTDISWMQHVRAGIGAGPNPAKADDAALVSAFGHYADPPGGGGDDGVARGSSGEKKATKKNYKRKPKDVEEKQVALYGDVTPGPVGDELTPDHIVSRAAAVKRIEEDEQRSLSKRERETVKKNTVTLVIPGSIHADCSETYKNRNTPTRIATDAADPYSAIESNIDALGPCLMDPTRTDNPWSADDVEDARWGVHDMNQAIGLYGDGALEGIYQGMCMEREAPLATTEPAPAPSPAGGSSFDSAAGGSSYDSSSGGSTWGGGSSGGGGAGSSFSIPLNPSTPARSVGDVEPDASGAWTAERSLGGEAGMHTSKSTLAIDGNRMSASRSSEARATVDDTTTVDKRGMDASIDTDGNFAIGAETASDRQTSFAGQTSRTGSTGAVRVTNDSLSAAGSVYESVEDGTDASSETAKGSLTIDANGLNVAASANASTRDDVSSKDTSAHASWDSSRGFDGVEAGVDRVYSLGGDAGSQTTQTSLGVKDGTLSAARSSEATATDGDTTTTSKSSHSGSVDGDGTFSVASSGESGRKSEFAGQTVESKRAGSFTATNDSIGLKGGYSESITEGDESSGETADGHLTVDNNGVTMAASASSSSKNEVSEHKRSASIGYDSSKDGLDGISAAVSNTRTLGDDDAGQSRTIAASVQDGKLAASVTNDANYTDDDGNKINTGSSVRAGVDADGNLSGGLTSTRAVSDDVSTTENTAGVSFDNGKAEAVLGRKSKLAATEGDAITRDQQLKFGTDGASYSTSSGTKVTDAAGTATETSAGNTVGFDGDKATFGRNTSTTVTNPDGTTSSTNRGMSIDSDGSLTGHASHSSKGADGKVRSVSGTGKVKMGEGGLEELSAAGNVKAGNLDAGAQVKLSDTTTAKKVGNKWEITSSTQLGGSIKGGASKTNEATELSGGSKVGGSVELGGGTSREVKRVLTDDQYEQYLKDKKLPERSLDNVEEWNVGEAITDTTTFNAGAEASASGGGVGGELGASHNSASQLSVMRSAEDKLEVTVGDASADALSAGVNGGPAKMKLGTQSTESHSRTIEIDMSSKHWKQALAYIRKHKTAPANMKGVKVIGRTDAESETDTMNAGAFGAEVSVQSGTKSSTKVDRHGNKDEMDEGHRGAGISLWGDSHHYSDHLTMHQHNDGSNHYQVSSTVDSTSATDARSALGRALGVDADSSDAAGENVGKRSWKVGYSFSEGEVDEFVGKLAKGKAHTGWLDDDDDVENLRLLAPGLAKKGVFPADARRDILRQEMSKLAADGGSSALKMIRETVDKGTYAADLELKGDRHFNGAKWRMSADNTLAQIDAELAGDNPDTTNLNKLYKKQLAALRRRKSAVGSFKRYPDLPDDARDNEVSKTQHRIEELKKRHAQIRDQGRLDNEWAEATVDYGLGDEMDLAFGGVDSPYALDQATSEQTPLGPVRDDYVPEETTDDLVKHDLRNEQGAEEGEAEVTADKVAADDPDVADANDSAELVRARAKVNQARAAFDSAESAVHAMADRQTRYSWATRFDAFDAGVALGRTADRVLQAAADRLERAESTLGDPGSHAAVMRDAATVVRHVAKARKLAARANAKFDQIPKSSAPWGWRGDR